MSSKKAITIILGFSLILILSILHLLNNGFFVIMNQLNNIPEQYTIKENIKDIYTTSTKLNKIQTNNILSTIGYKNKYIEQFNNEIWGGNIYYNISKYNHGNGNYTSFQNNIYIFSEYNDIEEGFSDKYIKNTIKHEFIHYVMSNLENEERNKLLKISQNILKELNIADQQYKTEDSFYNNLYFLSDTLIISGTYNKEQYTIEDIIDYNIEDNTYSKRRILEEFLAYIAGDISENKFLDIKSNEKINIELKNFYSYMFVIGKN